jgi:hypothetical protein
MSLPLRLPAGCAASACACAADIPSASCDSRRNAEGFFRLVSACVLVAALLLPSVFLVAEGHHHCTGDGCTICKVLDGAVALQNTGADVPDLPAAAVVFLVSILLACCAYCVLRAPETLVSLKVRLDD